MSACTYKIIAVLIISSLLLQCSNAQKAGASSEQIAKLMEPVEEGKSLPDTAWLINTEADTMTYQIFKGKWLLIDYWTAGCVPCIKEFPVLNQFYQSVDKTKMEIISLSVDNKMKRWKKAWKKVYQKKGYLMPSYYSGQSNTNPFRAMNFQLIERDSSTKWITTLTPQYVLINPDGKIIDKNIPKPSSKDFKKVLSSYMEPK